MNNQYFKITKEQFDELYLENITKKRYNELIELVTGRFSEIVLLVNKKGVDWFDFDNCDYESEDSNGYFEPRDCRDVIGVGGEGSFPAPFNSVSRGYGFIRTRWLWTDDDVVLKEYQTEVDKAKRELEAEKSVAKQKREELKARKAEMRKIIMAKLTKEELKYVKFK